MPAEGKIFLLSVFSDQLAYLLSSPLIQNNTLYYSMFTADSSFSFKDFKMQLVSVKALTQPVDISLNNIEHENEVHLTWPQHWSDKHSTSYML